MNAYEAFTTYMALKRHFTSDYDMFKYQGKLSNTDYNKFETRRDKYQFHKLSKLKNPHDFVLANILIFSPISTIENSELVDDELSLIPVSDCPVVSQRTTLLPDCAL